NPAAPVSVLGPIAGNAIWNGFGGPCASNNDGDPIVLYDELAHRWFISQFSVSGPYYNCIAVSQSGDPAGSWYRYAFLYSSTKMNDYPKYGVWPDGYYMTVNQFNNGSSWGGAGAAVYERDALLTGNPAARQLVFDLYSANVNFGGMLPSDFEGTPPAAGTPNFFAEVDDTTFLGDPVDSMRLWQFHVDWANPANSTFGLSGQPNQVLPVADYTPLCLSTRDCVPQPGSQKLDAIGDRLMYRLAYRVMDDGTQVMAVNHTVDAGSSRAGVRWYQLSAPAASTTFTLNQQGTYAGDNPASDTNHRWMGSIGIDRMGNLALGYSVSSGTVYPSVGLVGRLVSDPVNTLPQAESIVFSGTASQSGVNRWGDYSSMSIDPQDGCTFWYTTEYSSGSWDWRTRIVSFRYPNCTDQPTGVLSGTVTNSVTSLPIEGAHVTVGLYGAVTGADGAYSIQIPAGTYDVDFSAYAYLPETATNVVVTVDATTTLNAALDPAQLRTISGTVRDGTPGGHSYPLYARIDIAGYPNSPVVTDAIAGTYSVQLPEGMEFTLTASTFAPGYIPDSVTLTIPASNQVVDFNLVIDEATCVAPGYLMTGIKQDFDSTVVPALPEGWAMMRTGGTNTATAWVTRVDTRYPSGYPAQSGTQLAMFNSYSVTDGNAARLYQTTSIDMTALTSTNLVFWMFHDDGWTSDHDTIQVQVSLDNGTTWTPVGPAFDRVAAADAWQMHTVDLSAYATATNLRVGFLATSAYGNDIHLDSITMGAGCEVVPGGRLSGYIYDDNTAAPLIGATVDTGAAVGVSVVTVDPNLGDGFYTTFAPAGA
ncbi:carboxypeptidase-like regulatory domain-containing protein, partial [bacterium]